MQEAVITLAPIHLGIHTKENIIIRRADRPNYLSLNSKEFQVIQELATTKSTITEYLGRHLSGHLGLNFKEAVSLLVKLQHNDFLENLSQELMDRLDEASGKTISQTEKGFNKVVGAAKTLLDLPLISFKESAIHPVLRRIGAIITSIPALIFYVLVLVGLGFRSGTVVLPDQTAYFSLIGQPEILLLQTFVGFSLATSWIALLQMVALAGQGVKFLGGSIRVTGLCTLRLAVDDSDSFTLSGQNLIRYHFFTLISPWLMALLCWQFVHGASVLSLGGLFAATFVMVGYFMFCPLYRSALVKVGEGFLAQLNVLDASNNYLSKGLFSLKSKTATSSRKQTWVTVYACVAMVWLYAMFLLFFDALIQAVPDLWVLVTDQSMLVRAACAAIVLTMLILAMGLPFFRLIYIPIQNLAAGLVLPVRKARVGIGQFNLRGVPESEAIVSFLKEIPILGHLSPDMLTRLVGVLKYKPFNKGQYIVRQGEVGSRFFILAEGEAQIVLEGPDGEEVVDVLYPGDSFGEIALLEQSVRTASIRALKPCKTMLLEREAFNRLFPEGTEERQGLTNLIRYVKFILESQALSHLAPRQIRELLANSEFVAFKAGDVLIKEGEVGDAAYLVQDGQVKVTQGTGGAVLAELGRGELVGAIALIKEIPRTASVTANTDGQWLKIRKETFLKMCMSNMFVALLISDLSQNQLQGQGSGDGKVDHDR